MDETTPDESTGGASTPAAGPDYVVTRRGHGHDIGARIAAADAVSMTDIRRFAVPVAKEST